MFQFEETYYIYVSCLWKLRELASQLYKTSLQVVRTSFTHSGKFIEENWVKLNCFKIGKFHFNDNVLHNITRYVYHFQYL